MINYSLVILLLSIFSVLMSPAQAADTPNTAANVANGAANGKKLHKAKCFGCHDTRQYTRKNRIVHTYEDLHARVEFCDTASNAGFSFDELDDVVAYLNTEFYKFKQ
jgi:mono/diheme cytochrome c family protein